MRQFDNFLAGFDSFCCQMKGVTSNYRGFVRSLFERCSYALRKNRGLYEQRREKYKIKVKGKGKFKGKFKGKNKGKYKSKN